MNERIKKLRKSLDLTQQEFAKRIGTTANVLTNYETGRRNPSSSVINNICKTFHVREEWLRDGEGDMENESNETILDQLSKEYNLDSLEHEMINAYLKLDLKKREALKQYVKTLLQGVANNSEACKELFRTPELNTTEELTIEEKVEAYRQKLLREAGKEITPEYQFGTPEGIAEAKALYEKSLGIVPNTALSASITTERTEDNSA